MGGGAAGRPKPLGNSAAAKPAEKSAEAAKPPAKPAEKPPEKPAAEKLAEKVPAKAAPHLGMKAIASASNEKVGAFSSRREGGKASLPSSRESTSREVAAPPSERSPPLKGTTASTTPTQPGPLKPKGTPSASPAPSQRGKKAVPERPSPAPSQRGKARQLNLTVVKDQQASTPPRGGSTATSVASSSTASDRTRGASASSSRSVASSMASDRRGAAASESAPQDKPSGSALPGLLPSLLEEEEEAPATEASEGASKLKDSAAGSSSSAPEGSASGSPSQRRAGKDSKKSEQGLLANFKLW